MYNEIQATAVLTCISKNLTLLVSQKWPLSREYFQGPIHKCWYTLLKRLYKQGKLRAETPDLVAESENQERLAEIVEEYELQDMWNETFENLDFSSENYDGYYQVVNKWALLRDLKSRGYNIDRYYNAEEDCLTKYADLQNAKFIIEEFSSEISSMKTTYDNNYCRSEIIAGEHTEELLEMFKQTPAIGMPFATSAYSELTNGLLGGTLHCLSAASGTGKTIYAVSTICKNFASHYWSFEENCFVENEYYDPENGHAIMTHVEMSSYEEVNVRFLACISGVNGKKIRTGTFTPAEEKRILKAGEILKTSGIHIISMPDFTPQTLREKCSEINHKYGLGLLVHDYVEINPALSGYYKENKEIQRPDQIILAVMTELKNLAEELNIPILTFTQTNRQEDQMEFPDANCIAGAKAVANKLDSGAIMLPAASRQKDVNKGKKVYSENHKEGFSPQENISLVTYMYKSRSGTYGNEKIKIFTSLDYGCCRHMDLIMMTSQDQVFNEFDINKWDYDGWYPKK